MWPGLVGKGGPGAEPPIDLDTMLDLTAAAEVDGVKFDGVDLFLFDPHVSIDSSDDDLKRLADKSRARAASSSARSSRRSGRRPAAARRWDRTRSARSSSTQVRKACAIGKKLRELGVRHVRRRPHRLGLRARPTGRRTPAGNTKKIAETFREAARRRRGLRRAAGRRGRNLLGRHAQLEAHGRAARSWSDRPETLGFQADMAHTLLFTMGYNAPEDRHPAGRLRLDGPADARRGPEDDERAAALDDRLPRRAERRHGQGLRLARQDRPPLPADRSERQARHRHARRLLAARRATASRPRAFEHICWDGCMFPNADDDEARRPGTTSSRDDRRSATRTAGDDGMAAERSIGTNGQETAQHRPRRLRLHGPDPFERVPPGAALLRPAAIEPVLKAVCGAEQGPREAFAANWGYESVETDWRKLVERKDIDLDRHRQPQRHARRDRHRRGEGRQDGDVREAARPHRRRGEGDGRRGREGRRAEHRSGTTTAACRR